MKKEIKSARILFCLKPSLKTALKKHARSKGLSMTDVIEEQIIRVTKYK
jgi:hypothetical protein